MWTEANGLADALQAELDRAGLDHRARPGQEGARVWCTAHVEDGGRTTRIRQYAEDELMARFVLEGLRLDILHGTGGTYGLAPDLATVAAAVERWHAGAGTVAMAAAFPFLGSVELAEARERGDYAEVRWLTMYDNPYGQPHFRLLRPFLEVAFHEPALRRLRTGTSHWALTFDAPGCASEFPVVEPKHGADAGLFTVYRDRYCREILGVADGPGSVALVLRHLPPLGPLPSGWRPA